MHIQVILNLNQEEKVLGNKFIDNLKNLNGVLYMLTDCHGDEAKKKNSKWPTQKKLRFLTPPILNFFSRKF